MAEYKIEKNVPLPPRKGWGTGITAALDSLEVGDSFVLDSPHKKGKSNLGGFVANRRPKRFAERRIDNEHVRIWRVE